MKSYLLSALGILLVATGCERNQNSNRKPGDGLEALFSPPQSYVIAHTNLPPTIDGNLDEPAWRWAEWTSSFCDIEGYGKQAPYYATRAKMMWDSTCLYIAARLWDKHIWATLTERDQIIYADNDFEVFIDPGNTGHNYYELEVNAHNTMFDLFLTQPYRSNAHILISWNCSGLRHAVAITGTLNDPTDEDQGWTVEMAIPFKDLAATPKDGDVWRLNFSRVEWDTHIVDGKYVKKTDEHGKTLPEHNWVWSPTGMIDMHMPERWGYVQFSALAPDAAQPLFEWPYSERQRQYLWLVFYKQQKHYRDKGAYALSLSDLSIAGSCLVSGKRNTLSLSATPLQFTATISDDSGAALRINHEGLIRKIR